MSQKITKKKKKKEISEKYSARVFVTNMVSMYTKNHIQIKTSHNQKNLALRITLTLQRGVTGTARMLHALTHSSISRQVREQM
jgi:hypothetical protein